MRAVAHGCQLVHGHDWEYQKHKNNARDNQPDEAFYPRRTIIVDVAILSLVTQFARDKHFLVRLSAGRRS